MSKRFENLIQSLIRGGIRVCQTLFVSIVLTYILHIMGIVGTRFDIPLFGGILIFNTTLMYLKVRDETSIHRKLSKFAIVGLLAFVAVAGMMLCLGILWHEYSLVFRPLPILLLIPLFLTYLQASDEAARSHN